MARLSSDRSFIHSVVKACDDDIIAGLIFNRIDWSVDFHRTNNDTRFYFKGHWWMYDTVPDFLKEFPYCSERTMNSSFAKLKKLKLILHCRVRNYRRGLPATSFYTINYAEFEKLERKICILAPSVVLTHPIFDELIGRICILAHCLDLWEKAKMQNLQKLRCNFCMEQHANFACTSLSTNLHSQSETSSHEYNRGGEKPANPPLILIQNSSPEERKTAAFEELQSLWLVVDDFEYQAPEGQTLEERTAEKQKANKRIDELLEIIKGLDAPSEVCKKPPPDEDNLGHGWSSLIRVSYPNSIYSVDQLEKLARKAASIMRSMNLDFDFPVVLSWVHEFGSDYLKEKFFKSPRSIFVRDLEGNTFLEEAIKKTRDSFYRVTEKWKGENRLQKWKSKVKSG